MSHHFWSPLLAFVCCLRWSRHSMPLYLVGAYKYSWTLLTQFRSFTLIHHAILKRKWGLPQNHIYTIALMQIKLHNCLYFFVALQLWACESQRMSLSISSQNKNFCKVILRSWKRSCWRKSYRKQFFCFHSFEVLVVGINEKGCQAIKTARLKEHTTMPLTRYVYGSRKWLTTGSSNYCKEWLRSEHKTGYVLFFFIEHLPPNQFNTPKIK